jgi:hypothetical protein
VQLTGVKRWSVAPSGLLDPLTNLHPMAADPANLRADLAVHRMYSQSEHPNVDMSRARSFVLRPGSVFYVPAGWYHMVETQVLCVERPWQAARPALAHIRGAAMAGV